MKFIALVLSFFLAVLTVAFLAGLAAIVLWLAFNYLLEMAVVITILSFTVGYYGDMTDYVRNTFRRFQK